MISEHTEIKHMPLTALEYGVYMYHLFESLPQKGLRASLNPAHTWLFHLSSCLFSEPPGQNINAIGNGYDDVDELPVPINPFLPGMNENNFSPKDRGDARYSQTGELTAQ